MDHTVAAFLGSLPCVLGTQRYDGTLGQVHFVTDGDSVYLSTERDRQKAHDIADVTAGILRPTTTWPQ